MTTNNELREKLEAYEAHESENGEYPVTSAYITALETHAAAQQQRIDTLTAALEPFAILWRAWLDSSAHDGETPGAFTEWLYDESVIRVAHDYQRAHEALRGEQGAEAE